MKTSKIDQRHRYPAAIISHCVWLYYHFTLSYRDIALIMMQKRISDQRDLSQTAKYFNLVIGTCLLWVKTYEYNGEVMFDVHAGDVFSPKRKLKIIKGYQTTWLIFTHHSLPYE